MGDILRLESFDFGGFMSAMGVVIIGVLVLAAALLAGTKIVGELSKVVGRPVKWVKNQNQETEKVEALQKAVLDIQTQMLGLKTEYATIIVEIKNQLGDLKTQISEMDRDNAEQRADQYRNEILAVASAISRKDQWYTVEQVKHALKSYDRYEALLKRKNLENGEVDLSIKVIQQAYESKYKGMGDI